MLQSLYDLIYNNFFAGTTTSALASCATELCSLMSIALMAFVILVPIFLVFGFVKWVWRLFDR